MEAKEKRKAFNDREEEPRHTRLADVYELHRAPLFQGWGPKIN